MDPSEKFHKFAAECQRMAKFTHSAENRAVWTRMAERWLLCAQLYDRQSSAVHAAGTSKRHRTPAHAA
jgi:hypothetical protein